MNSALKAEKRASVPKSPEGTVAGRRSGFWGRLITAAMVPRKKPEPKAAEIVLPVSYESMVEIKRAIWTGDIEINGMVMEWVSKNQGLLDEKYMGQIANAVSQAVTASDRPAMRMCEAVLASTPGIKKAVLAELLENTWSPFVYDRALEEIWKFPFAERGELYRIATDNLDMMHIDERYGMRIMKRYAGWRIKNAFLRLARKLGGKQEGEQQ